MSLVSLRDVGFTYAYADAPALSGLDLELEPGLLYGVVGRNESGKSTLCSLIRGIVPHFHTGDLTGEVEVLGRPLLDWDPGELSLRIGCVLDNPYTQISGIKDTVFEEVALGLENLGVPRDEMFDRVEAVLDRLRIRALAGKNPNELSGGQRQKVAFASILVMGQDFLVIDEPTSQLDPEASEAVFEIIADLRREGRSVVLVEHEVDLLAEHADRIVVMSQGSVVAEGPTRDVLGSDAVRQAEAAVPEVTQLAHELRRLGRPLSATPVTRAEATGLVRERMQAVRR